MEWFLYGLLVLHALLDWLFMMQHDADRAQIKFLRRVIKNLRKGQEK